MELYLRSPYTPPPQGKGQIHVYNHIKENGIDGACSTQTELKFILEESDQWKNEARVS